MKLDEHETHVYSRETDVLAARNEQLEGEARFQAEEQMRKAAIDAGILDRARAGTDRTLRALLRSLGHADVELRGPTARRRGASESARLTGSREGRGGNAGSSQSWTSPGPT